MISKIISSAEPGVERAALDVARKLGLEYGGWISKDKFQRDKQFMLTYRLVEFDSFNRQLVIENNTKDADGVLVISRGVKIDRPQLAVKAALKFQRQFLGLDLTQYPLFEAASLIASWAEIHRVRTVFITGPLESEVKRIYSDTHKIMETVFYLSSVKSNGRWTQSRVVHDREQESVSPFPETVEACLEHLKSVLSLKDRAIIANLRSDELGQLRSGLGEYIKQTYGLYSGNAPLFKSCEESGKLANPLAEEASAVILRALWMDLQRTHKLRLIR